MENQTKEPQGAGAGNGEQIIAPAATAGAESSSTPGQAGAVPGAPFDPLADAAAPKATRPVVVSTADLQQTIPEPTFEAAPISSEPDPLLNPGANQQQNNSQGSQGGPTASWDRPAQPDRPGAGGGGAAPKAEKKPVVLPMMDMTPEERSTASDNAAKAVMQGYKLMHTGMNTLLQVSPYKQARMARKGELELSVPLIPTRAGGLLPISSLLKEYNDQVKETFTVDPEFEEEVTPILQRVLAKHGIGMSDEARLIGMFAQDFGVKLVGQFIPMYRQRGFQIDELKDLTKAYKEGHPPVAQAAPTPTMTHAAPPPPADPAPPPAADFHEEYVDQRGPFSSAQSHAMGEYGHAGLAHRGQQIERRWGKKDLLRKADQIAKKYQKKNAGGAGAAKVKKKR